MKNKVPNKIVDTWRRNFRNESDVHWKMARRREVLVDGKKRRMDVNERGHTFAQHIDWVKSRIDAARSE